MEGQNNQPQININTLDSFICECGNKQFDVIYEIRKLSKFYSPSGKDEYVPIQLFKCNSCGKIQYKIAGIDEKGSEKKSGNKSDGIIRSLK